VRGRQHQVLITILIHSNWVCNGLGLVRGAGTVQFDLLTYMRHFNSVYALSLEWDATVDRNGQPTHVT
jgi:hypothetical protein